MIGIQENVVDARRYAERSRRRMHAKRNARLNLVCDETPDALTLDVTSLAQLGDAFPDDSDCIAAVPRLAKLRVNFRRLVVRNPHDTLPPAPMARTVATL
jgi:hypothetical protein